MWMRNSSGVFCHCGGTGQAVLGQGILGVEIKLRVADIWFEEEEVKRTTLKGP